MSKQSAKTELVDLMTGPEKNLMHGIIYSYNGCFKSHYFNNIKRHSIDKVTAKEAKKLLSENRHLAVMLFQSPGKKVPAWMGKVLGCAIPVDPTQEDLVKRFFNYEFPPVDYASPAEYYKAGPPPGDDLSYPVDHLWMDYVKALCRDWDKAHSKEPDTN